ncbi:unnamed protein product [Cyprideis torosa]|uniref:Uncharacterized protein n=1 Tax=Cyprideis torosa TaxID=163714 RepID=A0A7R8WGT5_9CRUS|nr:unnamed protein product [Cyprideis torosa]CAG0898621.1 unnamed protein product [Cyprideis torosa]
MEPRRPPYGAQHGAYGASYPMTSQPPSSAMGPPTSQPEHPVATVTFYFRKFGRLESKKSAYATHCRSILLSGIIQ